MRRLVLAFVLCLGACSGPASEREPILADESAGDDPAGDETAGDESESASAPREGRIVAGDDPCTSDSDCVPAECCHASACVGRDRAPDCGQAVCTMECRYGTIDCGGGCLCHEGRCAARLSEAPDLEVR